MDKQLQLSDAAIKRIRFLKKTDASLFLRIVVEGGGCSGFKYVFSMDSEKKSDDLIFSFDDVEVVIDDSSISLLEGSVIDYMEDLSSAKFVILNPNATSKCGCGNSFSL